MKKIPLRRINKDTRKREVFDYTIVDDEDYEWLNQYKWSLNGDSYVHSIINGKSTKMHLIIMNKYYGERTNGEVVDHINLNKLDNQKSNLRRCTFQQNTLNRIRHAENETSEYKGVNYRKESGHWRVRIMVNGKQKSLGTYKTEIEAAVAYNIAAKEYHGEFAFINDIPEEFKDIIPIPIGKSSVYIGVELRSNGKFCARIKKNGKKINLGTFGSPILAAMAYDDKAKEFHGNNAKVNFPKKVV